MGNRSITETKVNMRRLNKVLKKASKSNEINEEREGCQYHKLEVQGGDGCVR